MHFESLSTVNVARRTPTDRLLIYQRFSVKLLHHRSSVFVSYLIVSTITIMSKSTSIIPPELQQILLEGPAMKSPPEGKSNFINPYSFYGSMVIGEGALYIFTSLIVGTRVYAKLRIVHKMTSMIVSSLQLLVRNILRRETNKRS